MSAKLQQEIAKLKHQLELERLRNEHYMQTISELRWDAEKAKCETFYTRMQLKLRDGLSQEQFSQAEIATLIRLVHPDKHDGKDSAKVMTQKLLGMRK